MTRSITASQLRPGDVCVGSQATIHRVVRDGLFERNSDDSRSRRPFPKGKVEVMVSYPPSHTPRVTYWNSRTPMEVRSAS